MAISKKKSRNPTANEPDEALIDFAIITALEVERLAICKVFNLKDKDRVRKDARVYWRGRLKLNEEAFYEIVVAQSPDMANVDAALLTSDTLHHWDPAALLLVGVAAAASDGKKNDDESLGDIVIASDIYYYERGKIASRSKKPEHKMYKADATLWNCVIAIPKWKARISALRPDGGKDRPKIFYGVIASGEKVIAEKSARDEIANGHRKIRGIEMEGYGFSAAVWQSFSHRRHLVIKAICDRGDRNKKDNWHPYAAAAAAGFAKHFLLDAPLEPRNNLSPKKESAFAKSVPGDYLPASANTSSNKNAQKYTGEVKAARDSKESEDYSWDVFISYSRSDETMANRIKDALKHRGVRVWIDKEQILPGDLFPKKIEEGLNKSAAVAILISPDAANSKWVEEEYNAAISLTKRPDRPVRLIPVLLREADLPSFLSARQWVNFKDDSLFDDSINLLISGINGEPTGGNGFDPVEKMLLSQLAFLSFFSEGLLSPVYDWLIARMKVEKAARVAEQKRLVRKWSINQVGMAGVDSKKILILRQNIQDEPKAARDLLALIEEWLAESFAFDDIVQLGAGRITLVRDLLLLARYLSATDEAESKRREQIHKLGRRLLPLILDEDYVRLGLEISKELLGALHFSKPVDHLTYARLLLRIGEAEQAADIFEAYRGDELFVGIGLSDFERIFSAIDWASASKDAGRAGVLHSEIIAAYNQMLTLVEGLSQTGEGGDELRELRADILHNRATQIAVYGKDSEWVEAQADLEAAAKTYQSLNNYEKLLDCQANFVSHSLDRFKRDGGKAPEDTLQKLLTHLESLDKIASGSRTSEILFFFFYQKGRLLRRLYSNDPGRAIEAYTYASRIAQDANMTHRFPIAERWVLRLKNQADLISEEEYLLGLEQCAATLRQHVEDAWAARSLCLTLLDIARVLRNRKEIESAWAILVEAFESEARLFGRGRATMFSARFRDILRLMDGLNASSEIQAQFIRDNTQLLRLILDIPSWRDCRWTNIKNWTQREERR